MRKHISILLLLLGSTAAFSQPASRDSAKKWVDSVFGTLTPDEKIAQLMVIRMSAIDPATRRLTIRATIDNTDGSLKPEMFANVTIFSPGDHPAVAVPKQALIYEADNVRLWVAHDDKSIELRPVKVGLSSGNLVEVTENLKPGERVVVKGGLFIDRAASGS